MTTFLIIRGIDPIEVEESFNLVRQRVNEAITGTARDGSKAEDKIRNRPLHKLTFKTTDGGRIAPVPENILAVGSDETTDMGADDEE